MEEDKCLLVLDVMGRHIMEGMSKRRSEVWDVIGRHVQKGLKRCCIKEVFSIKR